MAEDQQRPPVGSVAEEAARLLDALGGWASTAAYAAHEGHPAHDGSPGGDPEENRPTGDDEGQPVGADSTSTGPTATGATGRCEHCGAANGVGQAASCQLCPVCQGIGLLRSVRPETVDRLADLAGAVAATLRDLATQRRGGPGQRDEPSGRTRTSRVQDIRIEDEESTAP